MPELSTSTDARPARLAVVGLTKRFGVFVANDRISLDIAAGELHCLFGENGAGKSTLCGCLYGLLRADEGEILLDGVPLSLRSPRNAIAAGIGMVHQRFTLVDTFTVLENIVLGTRNTGMRQARRRITELCTDLGVSLPLDVEAGSLAFGERQWLEIIKALYVEARLLILDEPTAALTPDESVALFGLIDRIRRGGVAVILISHKLEEVLRCDRITVLRRGRAVMTVAAAHTTREELAGSMLGEQPTPEHRRSRRSPSGVATLSVRDLCVAGANGRSGLSDISFDVNAGEVLGVAGIAGNGQDELFEAIAGIDQGERRGEVALDGSSLRSKTALQIAQQGMGYVSADRDLDGLIASFSIAENLLMGHQRDRQFRYGPLLNSTAIATNARTLIQEFDIRTHSENTPVCNLSGGNAQKVVLARELPVATKCLLLNRPTAGLDVGTINQFHVRILNARKNGVAVLLASEELEDLIFLADRILVLFRGRAIAILESASATVQRLGLLMAGHV